MNGGLPIKSALILNWTECLHCSVFPDDFDKTAELVLQDDGRVTMPEFAIPANSAGAILLTNAIMIPEFLKCTKMRGRTLWSAGMICMDATKNNSKKRDNNSLFSFYKN